MSRAEDLYARIDVLCGAGLISGEDADTCRETVDMLLSEKEDVDEERSGIFITHLAMALKRAQNGQTETPIDAAVLEELKEEPVYEKAAEFFDRMTEILPEPLPDAETGFIMVHLCNVLA
ncbi:PRD domain-containing protein [Clostridium sp. Marseille-P3244]|uniref:PRD domain-containing protein n=1 Tax=Clostridium sp. Marseille-P3244 TaxID=1871020 RepID=UPI000931EA42|nr:PRD domain-containing protein [Clostridium sp. Marseille-P3244]